MWFTYVLDSLDSTDTHYLRLRYPRISYRLSVAVRGRNLGKPKSDDFPNVELACFIQQIVSIWLYTHRRG